MKSFKFTVALSLARRIQRRHGLAALTVVMILFFVMAMVAAYTNRNLIFEQRIATNSYRANRALEAADAGVEWTVAMLNGGRIDARCQPSIIVTNTDFRHRYHTDAPANANGEGGYDVAWADISDNRVYPACVNREGALSCICPTVAAEALAIGGTADSLRSAFRIEFLRPGNAVRPGAIEFAARGCASVGVDQSACTSQTHTTLPSVDGLSGALTTVGLVRALPIPPIAALTAGTSIDSSEGGLRVPAGNPSTAIALQAGTISRNPAADTLDGPALENPALSGVTSEQWFRAMFGQDSDTYQRQPAVRFIDCTGGCTSINLTNELSRYPRNPIWVKGDLNLNAADELGYVDNLRKEPLMLVVTGQLTLSAGAQIIGFVHADRIVWSAAATTASVRGAMVARTTFVANGLATLTYDRSVLDIVRLRYGSFVRVPGSWNLIFR